MKFQSEVIFPYTSWQVWTNKKTNSYYKYCACRFDKQKLLLQTNCETRNFRTTAANQLQSLGRSGNARHLPWHRHWG